MDASSLPGCSTENTATPQGWGWFGNISFEGWDMTARGISGDKGPTATLARLAGPRKSLQPPGALPSGGLQRRSAFAQRRLAEDGCPAQGERERSRLRGQRAGAPGGRGESDPGCPVSTGPLPAPPASVEAPEGAGWAGRGMSPPGAERGCGSSPPGPPRYPGQGAARPTCLAAEPEKGLKARGG